MGKSWGATLRLASIAGSQLSRDLLSTGAFCFGFPHPEVVSCLMGYDGRTVANFVLDFCASHGRAISNLSLQKIVYFCHVWSLIELGRPLVKQQFEAWQYGPVLQYLYREFKAFDRAPITSRATALDPNTGEKKLVDYDFDSSTDELLNRVVNFYSQLNASQLVELSHVKNGPWHQVWNHQGSVNPGMTIDNECIAAFYRKAHALQSIQ